jgi:glycosyltransferase involved in cell wall biosynthesis
VVTQIASNRGDYPGVDDVFARVHPDYEVHGLSVNCLCPGAPDRLRLLPCLLKLLPGLRRSFYGPLKDLSVRRFAQVYQKRLVRIFQDADLIHAFMFDGPGLAAQMAASARKVPFVITPFMHAGSWGDNRQNIETYNRADAVIALHEADREALIAAGVHQKRVRVCPVGVAPFKGRGEDFRQRHGLSGTVALFVGRMLPFKGFRELIAAVSGLRRSGLDITLVLLGPSAGEARKYLESIRDPGIRYLGHVSEQQKHDACFACDVLCLPSMSEVMPVSLLEAWYAGKPVLAGNIPNLACLVRPGKNGFLVEKETRDIEAKLKKLVLSAGLRETLGRAGRAMVMEKYLIGHAADRLKAVYQELL